jgi:hypothetical protein
MKIVMGLLGALLRLAILFVVTVISLPLILVGAAARRVVGGLMSGWLLEKRLWKFLKGPA